MQHELLRIQKVVNKWLVRPQVWEFSGSEATAEQAGDPHQLTLPSRPTNLPLFTICQTASKNQRKRSVILEELCNAKISRQQRWGPWVAMTCDPLAKTVPGKVKRNFNGPKRENADNDYVDVGLTVRLQVVWIWVPCDFRFPRSRILNLRPTVREFRQKPRPKIPTKATMRYIHVKPWLPNSLPSQWSLC